MSIKSDLMKQLAAAPEVEVIGIVAASGVGCGWSHGDELWTFSIPLLGWKVSGGQLNESSLNVRKEVPEHETEALRGSMEPYDIVRLKVQLAEENVFGSPQALLRESFGKDDSDAELADHATRLQEPVTFGDPQFGAFTLNRRVDRYEAMVSWAGDPARLTILAGNSDAMNDSLAVARKLFAEEERWRARIVDYAVATLLSLKNDCWLDEDECELTAQQFALRMKIDGISIMADGSFEFWYDDGDLFRGHWIKVCGNLSDGPNDADIPG